MQSNLLAVNIALLLPREIDARVREMNRAVWNETHTGMLFDVNHVPHVTLVLMYVERRLLAELHEAVGMVLKDASSMLLRLLTVHTEKWSGITSYDLTIGQTAELQHLHERLLDVSEVHAVRGGTAEAFVQEVGEAVRPGAVEYVERFRDSYSRRAFYPHVTVGAGDIAPTFEKPIDFTIETVASCSVGNFVTCRRVLASWKLQS